MIIYNSLDVETKCDSNHGPCNQSVPVNYICCYANCRNKRKVNEFSDSNHD